MAASTLKTHGQLTAAFAALQNSEAEVTNDLSNLLAATEPINIALQRLSSLASQLETVGQDAIVLHKHVSKTAKTADRVGSKVKALDEEMRRVREASERVAQVMELKAALRELHDAIDAREWETAARYCARAMSIPADVINGAFAKSAVPTSQLPLPPAETLQRARERLLEIFKRQFEEASIARDSAATSRVFKLFPEIGWEAEGLDAYSSFVVDLIRARTPNTIKTSSPMYYVATVTALFENIAVIVDQHQPIVDKYYGDGKMIHVVARLMRECDRVVKGLIQGWEEERAVKRKLAEVQASQKAGASAIQKNLDGEEAASNAKEIDRIISEIAGLAGRWGLFRRFLLERLKADDDSSPDTPQEVALDENAPTVEELKTHVGPEITMLESAKSTEMFSDLLSEYYVPLELWHLRTSIEKAHRLSAVDSAASPPTTTTPDDSFFILQNVLSRILSTASLPMLSKIIGPIRKILEKDYAAVIRRKLDDVYRAGIAGTAQRSERSQQDAYIILLNDMDTSSSHMERLAKDLQFSSTIEQSFLSWETDAVQEHIGSLVKLLPTFRALLKSGLEELFNQLMRPRLRSLLQDVYKDQTYLLDEDTYATAESNDLVRKRFVKSWDTLMSVYKQNFTETNYRTFFGMAIEMLVKPWEKMLLIMRYSELGAVRLDRDIRAIVGYLSTQAVFGNAREKFQRLYQVSTLLNLDADEDVEDFYSTSGIAWKLSLNECRSIAALRQ